MAYIISDLITSVRKRAKDLSFDSALITEYLQETQNELVNRSRFPFMQVDDNDYVAVGSTDYDLNSDVDIILVLRLTDETTNNVVIPDFVPYTEFFDRYLSTDNQTEVMPSEYTVYNNAIVWAGLLDKTYNMTIKYLKKPTQFTDGDGSEIPDIPEQYKEILLRGALARVEDYRGNFDISAVHQRKVEDLAEDLLVRTTTLQSNTSHKAKFGTNRRGW